MDIDESKRSITTDEYVIHPYEGKLFRVKSKKEVINKPSTTTGYVYIQRDGQKMGVHRIIYKAFHGIELTPDQQVNHINLVRHDNRIQNLELVSNKLNAQWTTARTGEYKGANFSIEKNKWKAELKLDNKNYFLGYFDTEIEAGKAYNQYALYLNETTENNYMLNEIEGYITVAKNIPEDTKERLLEEKSSKFNGVSYDNKRKYYVVSIKMNGKSYHLGHHLNEVECGKIYNQQALYFNNHNNTKYTLNDIPGYITVEKNIYEELQNSKQYNKTSKYSGVTFNKQKNKYMAYLVYHKKRITIGFFTDEKEAAREYNKKAEELNQQHNTTYKINVV